MLRFAPVLALLFALVPPSVNAQGFRTFCPPGQAPHFVGGFAVLAERVGPETIGAPMTCEFPDPNGTGDVMQLTTQGLAFWRKRTNTPTFTNGFIHFAVTERSPLGTVYWYGTAIDPPLDAALPQGAPENRCIYVGQPDC